MDADELADLMAEPPGGGESHGRRKTEAGWRYIGETYESDLPYVIDDPEYNQGRRLRRSPEGIPHGTRGGYTNHRCRCDLCRKAQRDYLRKRRLG